MRQSQWHRRDGDVVKVMPRIFEFSESFRVDSRQRRMREVLAEALRFVNQHRTRDDEVSNRFTRFVKQYEDVNMCRMDSIAIE